MKKIEWSDEYSVGVSKLDEQHKTIVDLINQLIEFPDCSNNSEVLHETLNLMMKYSMEHLNYEEKLMIESGYPDTLDHKNYHTAYIERYADLSIQAMRAGNEVTLMLLKFLRDWWNEHILVEDMKYKPFFKEKGIS